MGSLLFLVLFLYLGLMDASQKIPIVITELHKSFNQRMDPDLDQVLLITDQIRIIVKHRLFLAQCVSVHPMDGIHTASVGRVLYIPH